MEEKRYVTMDKHEIEALIKKEMEKQGYDIKTMHYHVSSNRFNKHQVPELVNVKMEVKVSEPVSTGRVYRKKEHG